MGLRKIFGKIPGVPFLYRRLRNPVFRFWFRISRWFRIDGVSPVYDKNFFDNNLRISEGSAKLLADYLSRHHKVGSMIDVGCGNGVYMREFLNRGWDVFGVDGSKNARKNAVVDRKLITIFDLRKKFDLDRRFDLALCIEVAEHIETDLSRNLVSTLASVSDTIYFTAAPPGQGGTGHINEQPREFWEGLFRRFGYQFRFEETERLRKYLQDNGAVWFLPRNIMVFMKISD